MFVKLRKCWRMLVSLGTPGNSAIQKLFISAIQKLSIIIIINAEKPRVGTLVTCCLREALDVSLEVSGFHGSQVARCNQPFPCSGLSTFTLQRWHCGQTTRCLERKTAGVTAHYDPVHYMASLLRRHVQELNHVLVVQQSLQLVSIAIG